MPFVGEMVHEKGLDFRNQRRVVLLRDVKKMKWDDIAEEVLNLEKEHPTRQTVINCYNRFSSTVGHVKTKYSNCGRRAWKFTEDVETWVVRKLRSLRKVSVCTSTTLQHVLARERGVKVSASGIRKILQKNGFKWLPKSKKRVYSLQQRKARLAFAKQALRMSVADLRKKLAFSMDGVILTMPPSDATDRYNYCRYGEDHVWRKPSETTSPDLEGGDPYGKQAPLARCLPMWAGIGAGGVGIVTFHKTKKLSGVEWVKALRSDALKKAIVSAKPVNSSGPWHVLCDGEGFLSSKDAKALYRRARIQLWRVPPKSPDLNPVEKFWSWLRRHLRAMDLKDAVAKRPVLGKMAYRQRVRRVMQSAKARNVAINTWGSFRKTCREVVKKKGKATRG